jgi:hypothetical protein
VLVTTTSAPLIAAPVPSVTVPRIDELAVACPNARLATESMRARNQSPNFLFRITDPPRFSSCSTWFSFPVVNRAKVAENELLTKILGADRARFCFNF